jgi:DNA-directed RNA polymerase specialized sigma24 family protein
MTGCRDSRLSGESSPFYFRIFMPDTEDWEHALYRFARLLLRDGEAARKAVLETLEAGIRKRPPHIDPDRLVMLQFRDLRRAVLKNRSAILGGKLRKGELPANADATVRDVAALRLAEVLHGLPEPGRSAYALLLLDAMESEWIAKLLELTPAQFADTVQDARLAVQAALASNPEEAPSR